MLSLFDGSSLLLLFQFSEMTLLAQTVSWLSLVNPDLVILRSPCKLCVAWCSQELQQTAVLERGSLKHLLQAGVVLLAGIITNILQ